MDWTLAVRDSMICHDMELLSSLLTLCEGIVIWASMFMALSLSQIFIAKCDYRANDGIFPAVRAITIGVRVNIHPNGDCIFS